MLVLTLAVLLAVATGAFLLERRESRRLRARLHHIQTQHLNDWRPHD